MTHMMTHMIKRRLFLAGMIALSAGRAMATGHDGVRDRVNKLGNPNEQRFNIILQNANFIAANAGSMTKNQLAASYKYLQAAEKVRGLKPTVLLAIEDAKIAVIKAWQALGGTKASLEAAAKKALDRSPSPIVQQQPKDL